MPFSAAESLAGNWKDKLLLFAQHHMSQLSRAVTVRNGIDGCSFAQQASYPLANPANDTEAGHGIQDTRWGAMEHWNWSDIIDQNHRIENWFHSTNRFAQAIAITVAVTMGQAMDVAIINAMNASARAGKDGEMVVKLPSTQKISADSDGMSIEKLREARRILRSAQLYGISDPLYIGLTARQLDDLLANTKRHSLDHAAARALASGETNRFLDFEFIHCEQFPKIGATRSVFAWMKSGICLGIGNDTETIIHGEPGQDYAQKIHASLRIGAVRLAETKVVQIDCWDGD